MKTIISALTLLLLLTLLTPSTQAQRRTFTGNYGHALNLGIGIGGYSGYYGYTNQSMPVFHLNYEFDAANNFTLAPFITFYSYRNTNNHYRETVIPIGGKGTYYFDQILGANPDWDFYLAGSLGFSIVKSTWDDGYSRNTNYDSANPLFLDLHIGTEYHFNKKIGIFLDLSTGVSTIGLAFH